MARYTMTPLDRFDDYEYGFTIRDTALADTAATRYQYVGGFATRNTMDAMDALDGQMAAYYPDADARALLGDDCPTGLTARKTKNAVARLLAEKES